MPTIVRLIGLILVGLAVAPAGSAAAAAPTGAPAGQPDNVPCKIVEQAQPQFPRQLLQAGVSHGVVRVLLKVSAAGELADTLLTAYSRKAFAEEAQRVIKQWKFTPGRAKGQPVDTIIDLTFSFEVKEVLVAQRFSQDPSPAMERFDGFEYHAANVESLDRTPTPLNVVEPTYPQEWIKEGITGRVAVNFFIDETGQARFPIAAPGAHELLAGIAVAAVQQWRFIPPKVKGRPVLVRALQVFDFDANPAPEAKAGP
ncbi:MAG TPA: energy transducer TonB [Lacunisphaera sp.]|nr:energy transducer TonB [Lacunisphaera sp.]